MPDLAAHEPSPIPGWTVDESKLVASTRWHWSWKVSYVAAAVWNLGLPRVVTSPQAPVPASFVLTGEIAAVVFGLLALRAFFARTTIRFTARDLTVETFLAPWQRRHYDLAEIRGFDPFENVVEGYSGVGLRFASGVVEALRIDWQPLGVSLNHTRKRLFVAPPTHAEWMAAALNEMLERARQLGHDTYRS